MEVVTHHPKHLATLSVSNEHKRRKTVYIYTILKRAVLLFVSPTSLSNFALDVLGFDKRIIFFSSLVAFIPICVSLATDALSLSSLQSSSAQTAVNEQTSCFAGLEAARLELCEIDIKVSTDMMKHTPLKPYNTRVHPIYQLGSVIVLLITAVGHNCEGHYLLREQRRDYLKLACHKSRVDGG